MNMALVHQVASFKFVGTSTVWTCQDKAVDFYKINVIYLVLVNHTVNQFRTRCPECLIFINLLRRSISEFSKFWTDAWCHVHPAGVHGRTERTQSMVHGKGMVGA